MAISPPKCAPAGPRAETNRPKPHRCRCRQPKQGDAAKAKMEQDREKTLGELKQKVAKLEKEAKNAKSNVQQLVQDQQPKPKKSKKPSNNFQASGKDFISQLYDYSQREKTGPPCFVEYFTNNFPMAHVVIVGVASHPGVNFMSTIQESKQGAKHSAAQVALEWIRANEDTRATNFHEHNAVDA